MPMTPSQWAATFIVLWQYETPPPNILGAPQNLRWRVLHANAVEITYDEPIAWGVDGPGGYERQYVRGAGAFPIGQLASLRKAYDAADARRLVIERPQPPVQGNLWSVRVRAFDGASPRNYSPFIQVNFHPYPADNWLRLRTPAGQLGALRLAVQGQPAEPIDISV